MATQRTIAGAVLCLVCTRGIVDAHPQPPTAATPCSTDLDCSLNGVCTGGVCVCDKPWGGTGCGVLQYKPNQPVSAKSLYNLNTSGAPASGPCVTPTSTCDALNTWNGPIVDTTAIDGKYHMFNPLYRKGSLLATIDMMHGTADNITGPYTWRPLGMGKMGSNPAFVTYAEGGTTKYSLWVGGDVYVATSVAGPYKLAGKGPGGNPAPLYHNGQWYATTQRTTQVVTTTHLGGDWVNFSAIVPKLPPPNTHQEDPFMYIDKRGNWHIINHAFNVSEFQNCGRSLVSAHVFSPDGKEWTMLSPNVEPYTHTVEYEDGTSHTYTTLERPNLHFNRDGQLTHINLAADLMTQDGGCADYGKCPAKQNGNCACTNCKYADHAGSIIIALDYE